MNAIGSILLLLSSLLPTHALLQQSSSSPPLVISNVATSGAGIGTGITFDLTNASGKAIRAQVVAIDYFHATGAPGGRGFSMGIRGMSAPPQPNSLQAGEVVHERVRSIPVDSSDGTPLKFKLSVDYVLFTDGSSWGPDTLKESRQVLGTLLGHDQALLALRDMLDQKGPDAVADYLKNFTPLAP
jgi:hypothetical protein